MILLYNRAAHHLARSISIPQASYVIKNFSDGEIYIKINQNLTQQSISILVSTQPPAENLLEFFFLLDALQRNGTSEINVFFSYFGYARQSEPEKGEVGSAQFICDILTKFPLAGIGMVHVHAPHILARNITYTNYIDYDFFSYAAQEYDAIAAPDQGAREFAQKIAAMNNKEIIYIDKIRPEQEQVHITSIDGSPKGKKILLVDDIISTGRTTTYAAEALKKKGAVKISIAATHGLFSADAYTQIEKSALEKVYVTNSIAQKKLPKIEIYDVGPFIQKILQS
jgi:ribose-phosphate pyrophosphokinase